MGDDKKKFSELVLAERDKGNVVYLALDAVMSAPVKEIVKQPTDGLLWDLNRDEATALTFMDREGMNHWVNNFAVALVIKELKGQLDEALNEHALNALKEELASRTETLDAIKDGKSAEYWRTLFYHQQDLQKDAEAKNASLKRVREYVEEVCEEDFVMWRREQDALLTAEKQEENTK